MSSTQIGHWRATYTPGRWVVLAGPTSMVVLPPARPQHAALVNALWDDVVGSADIRDLAERLVRFRIDQVPHLGVFFFDETGMHSLVRGSVRVVDLRTGDVVADGDGVQTWSEVGLGHLRQVRVDVEPVDQDTVLQLPLVVGAVQASAIVLDATAPVSSSQLFVVTPTAGAAPGSAADRQEVPATPSPSAADLVPVAPVGDAAASTGPTVGAAAEDATVGSAAATVGDAAATVGDAAASVGGAAGAGGAVGSAAASALPHGHETSVSEADASTAAATEVDEELDELLDDSAEGGAGEDAAAEGGVRDGAEQGGGNQGTEQPADGSRGQHREGGQDVEQQDASGGGADQRDGSGQHVEPQDADQQDGSGRDADVQGRDEQGDTHEALVVGPTRAERDGAPAQDVAASEHQASEERGAEREVRPARADQSPDLRSEEAVRAVQPARRYEPTPQDEPVDGPGAEGDDGAQQASSTGGGQDHEEEGDDRRDQAGTDADADAHAGVDSDGPVGPSAPGGHGPWGGRPPGSGAEPAEQVAPLEGIGASGPVSGAPSAPAGIAARALGDPSDVVGSPEATAQALAADDDEEDLLESRTELMPDAWNSRRTTGTPTAGQGDDPRTAGPRRPAGQQDPGQPQQWQPSTGAGWAHAGPGPRGPQGGPPRPDQGPLQDRPAAEQGPDGPQRPGPYGTGPGGPVMAPPAGTGPGYAAAPGGSPRPGYGPGPGPSTGPGHAPSGQPSTGQPGLGAPYGPPGGQGPGGWPGPYAGQPGQGQPGPYGGQPGQGRPGPYGGQPGQSQPGPYGSQPGQPGPATTQPGQPGQPGPHWSGTGQGGPGRPADAGEPARPGQPWAPRSSEEDAPAAVGRPPGTAASAPDPADEAGQGGPGGTGSPPDGGLIRGVPGFGDAARPQRPVAPAAPESAADHDGATIFQTGIARRNKPSAQGSTQGEALVLATMCALQHPNPPEAERCRRCGGAVQSQNPRLVPRPVLAVLRPSTGAPLEVDRTVLVGRSPAATRVAREHVPRLLTVPSPSHDISRTHVQVTPEGWSLVVTDLHSTNGTTLIRPGEDPERERLTPGEPVTVEPGWALDLGDGVTITIERLT